MFRSVNRTVGFQARSWRETLRNRIEDMSNDQHSHSFRVDGILCNPKRTEETVVQVSESIVADVPTFVLVLLSASR